MFCFQLIFGKDTVGMREDLEEMKGKELGCKM